MNITPKQAFERYGVTSSKFYSTLKNYDLTRISPYDRSELDRIFFGVIENFKKCPTCKKGTLIRTSLDFFCTDCPINVTARVLINGDPEYFAVPHLGVIYEWVKQSGGGSIFDVIPQEKHRKLSKRPYIKKAL